MLTSPSTNPHKGLGRTLAILCFGLTGMLLFCGAFFVVAAATADLTTLPLDNVTNRQLDVFTAATTLIPALIALQVGWQLWGNEQRQEKAGVKTAVGCLLNSSLGCGLWAMLSAALTLLSGVMLAPVWSADAPEKLVASRPAGIQDVLVASSGFIIAIIVMLLIAGYLCGFTPK